MERAITFIEAIKPLIFALGFLTPVLAEGLLALHVPTPAGMDVTLFSTLICATWATLTVVRKGRWF